MDKLGDEEVFADTAGSEAADAAVGHVDDWVGGASEQAPANQLSTHVVRTHSTHERVRTHARALAQPRCKLNAFKG